MRYLTALLAVAITAALCSTAVAGPVDPPGTSAPPSASQNSGVPSADTGDTNGVAAVAAVEAPADQLASDGGLSAFLIVLIALGGAAAVATAGFVTMRLLHRNPQIPS